MSPRAVLCESKKYPQSFSEVEKRLDQTCDILEAINDKLSTLKHRHRLAQKRSQNALAYSIHMQLLTIEGVRGMYYEYASVKAQQLIQMSAVPERPSQHGDHLASEFTIDMTR